MTGCQPAGGRIQTDDAMHTNGNGGHEWEDKAQERAYVGPKYSATQKGAQNHAAFFIGASDLTLATELVDHFNGGACRFHAAIHCILFACMSSLEAKSATWKRWRCSMLPHCST